MYFRAIWHSLDASAKRGALWCGLLGSLVSVILLLNIVPPQVQGYRTIAYILSTQPRLEELRSVGDRLDNLKIESIEPIKPTTGVADPSRFINEPNQENWVVRVAILSDAKLDRRQLRSELSNATQGAGDFVTDDTTSKSIRKLKWKQQSLEHVALVNADDQRKQPSNFRFASTSNSFSSKLVDDETAAQLDSQLQFIDNELERLHSKRAEAVHRKIGGIEVATNVESQMLMNRLDWTYAAILLVMGIGGYGGFAWLYLSLQAKRKPNPSEVVHWLKNQGINRLGTLNVMSQKSAGVQNRASVPRMATGVKELLEISLLMILLAACLRICFDPSWRSLAGENLLFALGRIFWH